MGNLIIGAVVMFFGVILGASINGAATKAAKKNNDDVI